MPGGAVVGPSAGAGRRRICYVKDKTNIRNILRARAGREAKGGSVRLLAHPNREDIELTAVFHALSDPIRLGIVVGLLDGNEESCGGLDVPLNKSSLSHHLKVLREAGVTYTRIEGTHRYMSLRRADLDARFPGLLDAVSASVRTGRRTTAARSGR